MNWNLATGHHLSVDNEGAQTVVTINYQSAGQQQRSSNSFTTGIWLAPPELIMTPTGAVLKIVTASGESLIQIQGNSMQMQSNRSGGNYSNTSASSTSTSTSGFEPMPPMKPMQMGNMQMNMPSMVMRMGDMELNMGAGMGTGDSQAQRFCSQCGTPVKSTDKFCASCGNKL
jgi:NADH pyrophosphatase NudC (nudix superfamily)